MGYWAYGIEASRSHVNPNFWASPHQRLTLFRSSGKVGAALGYFDVPHVTDPPRLRPHRRPPPQLVSAVSIKIPKRQALKL